MIAFGILLVLAVWGWCFSKDIFSPFVLQPGVWCVILFLFYVLHPPYYPIVNQFPICLIVWSLSFLIGAYLIYYISSKGQQVQVVEVYQMMPDRGILKIYLWIATLTIPAMLFMIVHSALTNDPEHLLLYIRMANVGGGDFEEELPDFGVLNYFIPIAYILLFFSLLYSSNKKERFWVIMLNLMVAFLTMAKTNFLIILFSSIYIGYLQKKIKLKTMGIVLAFFLFFSVIMQFFRSSDAGKEDFSLSWMFSLYLLASSVAFDYFSMPFSSDYFGQYCFRFYYAISSVMGGEIAPVDTINDFVSIPVFTNTFTVMQPFLCDFGYYGLLFGGLGYGCLYGWLYKKKESGNSIYIILYIIFINYLVLQFFAEYILTNLSLNLQYIVYALLPFVFAKNVRTWEKR